MLIKEFIQSFRDRLTFAMMVGIPVMQLILFGYAINSDPKSLPIAVVTADPSVFTRSILSALKNTDYFRIIATPKTEADADRLITQGEVQFVLYIPPDFSRKLVRGERPVMLLEADATDPVATVNAIAAVEQLNQTALQHDLTGPLAQLAQRPTPFEIRVHNRYNPEGTTEFNIVPGLIGTILTMTLVMMTAIAVTRERERGTMENLLATPARPIEVMLGKIAPYIVIGYIQVGVILMMARFLFGVPMLGSLALLSLAIVLFIAANLAVGFTFSTLAHSQLQAMQMGVFFFLPSMLLSGFLFPFRGMPSWAQAIGELLPLTHMLRIVRGILLKGSDYADIQPDLWPMLVFTIVVSVIALRRYRQTLD
jgi:ABC-2 type transport system permease protein